MRARHEIGKPERQGLDFFERNKAETLEILYKHRFGQVALITYLRKNGRESKYLVLATGDYVSTLPYREKNGRVEVLLAYTNYTGTGLVVNGTDGGIENLENQKEASYREMSEEMGISKEDVLQLEALYDVFQQPDQGLTKIPNPGDLIQAKKSRLFLAKIRPEAKLKSQRTEPDEEICVEWLELREAFCFARQIARKKGGMPNLLLMLWELIGKGVPEIKQLLG